MTKQRFQGALNAATFPLISSLQERTVVQQQLDINIRRGQQFYGSAESANYNVPQLLYCENVVPTAEGLQSVGYESTIPAIPGASAFDTAITIRDADENNFLFSPAGGLNYIYKAGVAAWVSTNPISAAGLEVSRAYVNGRTFICYATLGLYEYNSGTNTFNHVTITGLADADVRGIGASNNYLIAYTDITVHWSSLINPLDFVPSLLTGAGFSIPQDVKAKISALTGSSGGFVIYTAKNAVAAVYTNNIRAPWNFKEISNAGGVSSFEQVTSEQNTGPQYAWTTGGLQKITVQGSETVSAEINDFLAGRLWEYWDTSSKRLIEQRAGAAEFQIKVTYISNRYLVISYSTDNSGLYQYALVQDLVLKRWGKLKIDHVDCFTYPYPNVFGDLSYSDLETIGYDSLGATSYADLAMGIASDPPSKKAMAFLSSDGAVTMALLDYNKLAPQAGVAIFGKFQLMRARMITAQTLDIEGAESDGSGAPLLAVTIQNSLDGKNPANSQPMRLLRTNHRVQQYAKRVTGLNLSVAVEGTFALSSYIFEVTTEGDR